MRQNPHVRICGGPGSATTLDYPTRPCGALLGKDPTKHSEKRSHALQFQGPAEVVHEQTMRDETDPGLHGY